MQYLSTRGAQLGSYRDVIVEGLAPDGGLAVPAELPQIARADLERWRELDYAALATEILGLFATDIPRGVLARMCQAAYSPAAFADASIVPLTALSGGLHLVGLSEGPTLAFKDMAMRFLGEGLDYVLTQAGDVLNILGATSGDTGSAAEYALRGRDRLSILMLSPKGRMSAFQRAQMYSLADENVSNVVVNGVFDDCQNLVKRIFEDVEFKATHHLGAVNSINFGRISAQIVYYFWAWLRASDAVDPATRVTFEASFAVPSGNFGNILSGHYARQMGLPVRHLVLATNENNVLDEFFRTGIYRPRSPADTLATSSPSMDISRASNLERFIFDLLGSSPQATAAAWRELAETGQLDLSEHQPRFAAEFGFVSGASSHADRLETIRQVHTTEAITIDPHTADGVKVARAHVEPGIPMLVLESAKPQKFAETITQALGEAPAIDAATRALLEAPQHITEIGDDEAALRKLIEGFALRD